MDDNEFISEVIQDCLEDNESEASFQVEAAQDFDWVEVTIYIQWIKYRITNIHIPMPR